MNIFYVILALLFSTTLYANSGPVGTFTVVKGEVKVQRSDGKIEKARIGLRVFPKDIIKTHKDARGKIVMVDKNIINLSPESKMEIQDYTYKPKEEKKSVLLNLMYGKVRSQVNEKYDEKNNTFRVKTSAAVAGVRGTDFIVSFQNNRSEVITFSGLVQVGSNINFNNEIVSPIQVSAGQGTSVSLNASPQVASPIPAAQLSIMDQETNADSTETRQPATSLPETTNETKKDSNRTPQSLPGLMPPPPAPPVDEVAVLPGPIAVNPSLPPMSDIPPVNPVVGDIIQQTNTSIQLIIVGP